MPLARLTRITASYGEQRIHIFYKKITEIFQAECLVQYIRNRDWGSYFFLNATKHINFGIFSAGWTTVPLFIISEKLFKCLVPWKMDWKIHLSSLATKVTRPYPIISCYEVR
jgi:hypothetical protein